MEKKVLRTVKNIVKQQEGIFSAERMADGKRIEGFLIGHAPFCYIATHDAVSHMIVDQLIDGKSLINLT